jgi:hypothetical protein
MDSQTQAGLGGAESGALAGSAFGPEGTLIGGVAGGLMGYFGTPKRPTYNIQPEVEQNKALGMGAAFGQNTGIAQGNAMADQTAAQDENTAQQYSSNAGTILNTLKSINNNRNQTKQGLSIADANLRSAGRGQLMSANSNAIDEADKAWNYNVNQPYQNQVAATRDQLKGNSENFWKLLDYSRAQKLLTDNSGGSSYNSNAGSAASNLGTIDL